MSKFKNSDIRFFLERTFTEQSILERADLLHQLRNIYPDATTETLVWHIHDFKRKGYIESPGRGVYKLIQSEKFKPTLGEFLKRIAALLAQELPLVNNCIWETHWVSNWMELQSPGNWIIVEVDKDVLETVFQMLSNLFPKVFLQPNQHVVELYVLPLHEAIIVKPLRSASPVVMAGAITIATPEKILVDIVAEPCLFRAQQAELSNIYHRAFESVGINQTKMLRYARRRHRYDIVFNLIPDQKRLSLTTKVVNDSF